MISSDYLAVCGHQKGTTCVLRLRGELDVCSRDGLRAAISGAFERSPEMLVLDLSDLEFMDCSGLSVLVWAHNVLAANGGQLLVTGCPLAARRLIRLTGADQYLHLCPAPALNAACREATHARQRVGIACWPRDAFRLADRSAPDLA
jgi:anti-sigma B factor antagonist